jgi:hypothetical protein
MIDIYKIYKQYYQRSNRHPKNQAYSEMTLLAHDLVKNMHLNRFNKEKMEGLRNYGISLAQKLINMEREERTYSIFGYKLFIALTKNEFEINVTYPVERRWNTSNINGEVYIMTSQKFPESSKLGATTLDIYERIRKFENRYRYKIELFYSLEIISPFEFEKFIQDQIKDKRLEGRSSENTNEWYSIHPSQLQLIIEGQVGYFIKLKNVV